METVNLFALATQQSKWLAVRQTAVAGNVANVNTPGYKAVDVEPFESVLDKTGVRLATTQQGHIAGSAGGSGFAVNEQTDEPSVLPSENSVVLEDELMKAGEVRRQFELNTAIVKAFQRMLLTASKG
ncbi:MAG: flagellar basal body rod protein FlgB [Mesorhizobium sp.]|nr:flagellar basal body rod protein FlgB [Mesorhizobium sp.]MBL8578411.1 flagellar basal body rod protein FlgB [Mesorhizobium sp.]